MESFLRSAGSRKIPGLARVLAVRDQLAGNLGVDESRRRAIVEELSRTTSLASASYWFEVAFSAGIATLGLVLNSPAVIIGAMLISPLMGPILANGLALASGDLVLGIRGLASLALSCVAAVGISTLLIVVLPFKEITSEISARVQPNTLDLFVALLSGAVGSLAFCKQGRGVVTSIPGVAVAVALMPPLCVCGFGIGYALSLNGAEGMGLARGGALLFLTNLLAITFAAMMVFLALRMGGLSASDKSAFLSDEGPEINWWKARLSQLHVPDRIRHVGSLPGRLLLAAMPLLLIALPLTNSFSRMQQEFSLRRSRLSEQRVVTSLWHELFGELPGGSIRSYVGQVDIQGKDHGLTVHVRAFTRLTSTAQERARFHDLLAAQLRMPARSLTVDLVEIPTASEAGTPNPASAPGSPASLTFAERSRQLSADLQGAVDTEHLPPGLLVAGTAARFFEDSLHISVGYLAGHPLGSDAAHILGADLAERLPGGGLGVEFVYLGESAGTILLQGGGDRIRGPGKQTLDAIGQAFAGWPRLMLRLGESNQANGPSRGRAEAAVNYLNAKWKIDRGRIATLRGPLPGSQLSFEISVAPVRTPEAR